MIECNSSCKTCTTTSCPLYDDKVTLDTATSIKKLYRECSNPNTLDISEAEMLTYVFNFIKDLKKENSKLRYELVEMLSLTNKITKTITNTLGIK